MISKQTVKIGGDDRPYNLKHMIKVEDYQKNSIRECQIATFQENYNGRFVKTQIISRSQEYAGEFEYEFKEAQEYKINIQIPKVFTLHKVEN